MILCQPKIIIWKFASHFCLHLDKFIYQITLQYYCDVIMTGKTISFTAPELLKMEIEASSEIGYYDNKSEFLRDATRTLLASRKDLRLAIACELYKKEKISLGRAVEIADVSYEEMKKILAERDIKIKSNSETVEEMKKRARSIGA